MDIFGHSFRNLSAPLAADALWAKAQGVFVKLAAGMFASKMA